MSEKQPTNSNSNSSGRSRSKSKSRRRPSHIPVWSATVLNEPVFLASGKGKEEFLAKLVVDVVPSLGAVRHNVQYTALDVALCVLSLSSPVSLDLSTFF